MMLKLGILFTIKIVCSVSTSFSSVSVVRGDDLTVGANVLFLWMFLVIALVGIFVVMVVVVDVVSGVLVDVVVLGWSGIIAVLSGDVM